MPIGGYREGSGRSKSGYYKGIYCASTYELCWVIHALDHNIKFDRFPGYLTKDNIKYYPDFLLADGNTIIETKGYESEKSVNKKTKVAEFYGYNVIVLRKDDLQFAFKYVKEKYGSSIFYDLYDNYRPEYDYACCACSKKFSSNIKKKTKEVFCSRKCAGLYRKSLNTTISEETKQKISATLKGRKVKVKPYKRKYKQMWITNGIINTRIKEGTDIPLNFRKGRTI